MKRALTYAAALPLLAPAAAGARTQDASVPPAPEGRTSFGRWLDEKLPAAIRDGRLLLNVRTRWEHADQEGLRESNAITVRTRFGYQTAPLSGFRGLLEFEDVTALGNEDGYNQTGGLNPGAADRTPIADPPITEVNQAYLSYERSGTLARLGRQRILLDDQRFVGNVGWRQNEQTYDALSLKSERLEDATFFYSYIHNVNRVFGNDHPLGDFRSDSHLFHASYEGFEAGTLSAYAYLLDFETAPELSSDTFGASFAGSTDAGGDLKLQYRAELAFQTDAGDNPASYTAEYYRVELGGRRGRFEAGAGYEVLGSDNGVGFSTPLATLHGFNGWADVFVTTPGEGLRDLFGWVGVTLPHEVPLKLIYHDYRSDAGSEDFGSEIDAVVSRRFGEHWTALAKLARYMGDGPFADTDKLWLQLEFSY